jgi:hypothetical protein
LAGVSKHFILLAALAGLFAGASPARAANHLHETTSGTISEIFPTAAVINGAVTGYPITGPMSESIRWSGGSFIDPGCSGLAFAATATVTLGSGANTLVKTESGIACLPQSFRSVTFYGTYVIDGADSTGRYVGTSGSGTTTPTAASDGEFNSVEDGTITSGRYKLPPPPRTPKPPPPPRRPKSPATRAAHSG